MAVRKTSDSDASKSEGISAKSSTGQTGDDSPGAGKGKPEGGENVDQIRDILFGAQRQDYERRFARLEELLINSISELGNETTRKFAGHQEEYNKRLAGLEESVTKVSEFSLDIERNINVHKGENDKSFRDLEEQLKGDIDKAKSEIIRSLEHLDMHKVDHSTLAKFLHHLAKSLEHKDTETGPIQE